MIVTVRKKSGFKEFSRNFWVNERSKYGCRYQCKHCGKVTLGMYDDGTDDRMHHSTCSIRKLPPMQMPRSEIEVRTWRLGDGTSCNACPTTGEVAAVLRVGRNETRFCAECLKVLRDRLGRL